MKRFAGLLIVVLLLGACGVVPPGKYTIPAGSRVVLYDSSGTPVYEIEVGEAGESTPTAEATTIPVTPQPTYCELRIGGVRQNVRADHLDTATIIGNIGPGDWMRVLKLFIYADITDEWAFGSATDINTGKTITGWVKLGTNAVLADSKECWEVEKEYPQPTPTPQPTATPGAPVSCQLRADSNVNIRTSPTGTVFRVALAGTEWLAEARYQGTSYLWYKIWVPEDIRYGWTADFYTELSPACGGLPFIAPF